MSNESPAPAQDGAPTAQDGAPTALARHVTRLVKESQALRGDLVAAEAARRRAGHINLAVLGILGVFVLLLLASAIQNNRITHQLADTNRQIADCTTVGGKCYEESRSRTGTAINDIIRAEIFMAECSRLYPGESGPVFDQHLEACVHARLSSPHLSPSTAPAPTPGVSPTGRTGG